MHKLTVFLLIKSILLSTNAEFSQQESFLVFCPCMGRFGNQIEQLLGVLAFAKQLNRTLVLPPLIEYPPGSREAKMREFDSLFRLEPMAEFHRVLPMRRFIQEIAPRVWPADRRNVLCWSRRAGLANPSSMGCHATEGNPFGPFWRHAGVQFVGDEFFGEKTGGLNTESEGIRQKWMESYPPEHYPVLAFSSAPAAFPIRPAHRWLQKFLQWNENIQLKAQQFIKSTFGEGPFVGVHFRNGPDWENVCLHLKQSSNFQLFASAQCTGENGEFGKLGIEACGPSLATVLKDIQAQVERIHAVGLFIATDWHHHMDPIRAHLANTIGWPVKVTKLDQQQQEQAGQLPALELAILGNADHFIGNCVSTFSAFVVRQRRFMDEEQPNKSTSFFGFLKAAFERLEGNENDGRRNEEL